MYRMAAVSIFIKMERRQSDIKIYRVEELAELLGLSIRTVRKHLGDDKIKCKRLGKRLYVTEQALEQYFNAWKGGEKVT